MNGAPKSPPAPEPAFDAAPLDDEADDASPALDLDLDDTEAEAGPLARGAAVIKSFWKHAPLGPGVYRMIGADGEVLYVGKARSIKKRVQSYTTPERQSIRIARMIAGTASMVFVTTETEAEALLLEANFIKQLKPRYNVLLRDDKSFPYILIAGGHDAPRLVKHRGARSGPGDYFGPFANAGAVARTLNALQRAFLLRTCSDSYYENRTRPCLLYQIKRCSAPCTGEIALGDYAELVAQARDFLSGRSRAIRQRLAKEMSEAAEALEFEKAARLRDRISALSAIQGEQSVNPRSVPEADVFAICRGSRAVLHRGVLLPHLSELGQPRLFSARRPRAERRRSARCLPRAILPRAAGAAPRAAQPRRRLARILARRLERARRPSHRHRRAAARRKEGAGRQRRCATRARRLSRKLAEAASQEKLLGALGAAFGIATPLRRVEVYDNSHIMGTNAIGAMIVAGPEGFVKNQYRTFNIKSATLTPGDDYAMMREVLGRRFARLMRQAQEAPAPTDESAFPDKPDLVIIDGGRGQFEAAKQVFAELGVEGVASRLDRQGAGPQCGARNFLRRGARAVQAAPARSRAVLRPAAARRGAPLRHRHASRQAQEGVRQEPARRNPRHRPGEQARAAARVRLGQGRRPRRPRRPRKDPRPQRRDGEAGL